MRLVGLKSGHAQVLLSVTGRNMDRSVFVHNSSLDIEVFDHLQWTKPWPGSLPLIVAPDCKFQVEHNKVAVRSSNYLCLASRYNLSWGIIPLSLLLFNILDESLRCLMLKKGNYTFFLFLGIER